MWQVGKFLLTKFRVCEAFFVVMLMWSFHDRLLWGALRGILLIGRLLRPGYEVYILARRDLLMNRDCLPKTRSVWPTLQVKIALKKWALYTSTYDENAFCWGTHWVFPAVCPCWHQTTVSLKKNTPDIYSCNLNKYFPTEIIFGTNIT